jgi:hypothetical protein
VLEARVLAQPASAIGSRGLSLLTFAGSGRNDGLFDLGEKKPASRPTSLGRAGKYIKKEET